MSNNKSSARQKIRYRIRKKINGTSSIPRLTVFRSNSDIYAQLIDDNNGTTIAAASSRQKDITAQKLQKLTKVKWLESQLQGKQLNWELRKWYLTVVVISFTAV